MDNRPPRAFAVDEMPVYASRVRLIRLILSQFSYGNHVTCVTQKQARYCPCVNLASKMPERIFNFSAGPAMLPAEVLQRACEELLSFNGVGMSIMEVSHRSRHFRGVLEKAESGLRELLSVPDTHRILFLQGGASLQFSMIPMNFLAGATADHVVTGAWGKKAVVEAQKCGSVNIIWTDQANGFRTIPDREELRFTPEAAYVHYTSNETIEGVEFDHELVAGGTPVICDASSDVLSKPIDLEN